MKTKLRSFTLVELLVVIVVMGILATVVTLSFTSAKNKADDRRALADVNSIASGLDQYSLSHGRKYPALSGCSSSTNCYEEITSSSTVYGALSGNYVNSMATSNSSYKLYYAVNSSQTKAVVSFGPAKTSNICNNTSGTIPTLASWLSGQVGTTYFCYYVAK